MRCTSWSSVPGRTAPISPPSEGDHRVLGDLVRRLDGLPLAIELAAARMSVLGPKQLLRRVETGLDVLADPRERGHGALRATLDWSWELLAPHERTALGQLSVFRGGLSAEAAEAVLDLGAQSGAPPVIDVLGSLRDQSFLDVTRAAELPDEVRFELLQIVRAYAEEKLPPADADRARERHARAFAAFGATWARDVDREDGPEALAHLAVELENLVGVHRWALASSAPDRVALALQAVLALEPVFYMRGPTALCLSLLGEALQAAGAETPPALLALALKARARALRDSGRFDESDADLERALELARSLGDRSIEGRVLAHVAACAQARGHHEAAIARLEEALRATREARDKRSEGMVLAALAKSFGEVGRLDEATRAFDEAMRIHREVGNRYAAAFVATSRAEVSRAKGHLESARLDLERGIAEYDRFGERRHEGIALTELAVVLQEQGKPDEARRACDRAVECHRVFGSRLLEGHAVGQLGDVERGDGRLEAARTCYAEAAVIAREVADLDATARWLVSLGSAEVDLGRRDVGLALIDEGEALLPGASPSHRAYVALHRGLAALGVDRELAASKLAEARAIDSPPGGHPAHVRLAFRLLESGLASGTPAAGAVPASARARLSVAESGRWFRRPDGETVNLQRRQALRLVLRRLAEAHRESPGVALTPLQILEAGWPGERVRPEAGLLRVYNALSTLRRMGLRDCLLSRDDGYLIDPLVPVDRVDDAP
jgi:tetratricopeptide (TPR) repeat protein